MPRFEWPVLRKPILGSQIDPTHPLASGLVSYIPLWEGGGPATRDIVSGSNLVTASATPWSSGLTSGLLCTTDGTGVQGNLPASLQIQPPLTMAIGFRLVSTPVVSCPALGIYVGGTSTRTLALETGSTLTINFVTATGTLLAKSLSLGTDYVAVVTAVSGNSSLYVNDVLAQNSASTYTVSYSSPTIQIGGVSFAGGVRNPGSLIYWTAIWNRFLAPVEIKQVSANPWQIFHPPPATLSIWYPSGGTSGHLRFLGTVQCLCRQCNHGLYDLFIKFRSGHDHPVRWSGRRDILAHFAFMAGSDNLRIHTGHDRLDHDHTDIRTRRLVHAQLADPDLERDHIYVQRTGNRRREYELGPVHDPADRLHD